MRSGPYHLNIRTELVFHTTSEPDCPGPATTYLNVITVRNQVQTREELKNYLVIPMLTVSCSRPVELDQTISSIIKNPESYQTVARLTCIGGKRM